MDHIRLLPLPSLTAVSRSVSSADHGVLRGPICDADRRLWSLLPRPDHVGGDLRRAVEVITFRRRKPQTAPPRWVSPRLREINGTEQGLCCLLRLSNRYIRSERSIILLNFCLSIVCSNILILVGQTQTHNAVSTGRLLLPRHTLNMKGAPFLAYF